MNWNINKKICVGIYVYYKAFKQKFIQPYDGIFAFHRLITL